MNINELSIEEKVGQLFLVGFQGLKITGETIHLISTYKIGGVYYSSENVRNPKQIHRLSEDMQLYAGREFPLLLAISQKGGNRNNMINGVVQSPSQSVLGSVNNRLYTKRMAEIIAAELYAMGINMNFYPSLHIDKEVDNSFSNSCDLVAKHGAAAIQGHQNEGVSAVPTHIFSHPEKVDKLLTAAYDDARSPLYPVYKAIQNDVDALFVSKKMIPDPGIKNPALYSRSMIHRLLRDELLYEGVLMSTIDAKIFESKLEMAKYAVTAIQAGVDLLFIPASYSHQIYTINRVIEAVKSGELQEEWINHAVDRIIKLKRKRNIGQLSPFNREKFEQKRDIQFVNRLNDLSVTSS